MTKPRWAYFSWPLAAYTPVLAYIFYIRRVHGLSWPLSVSEGVDMWRAYFRYEERYG